MLRALLLFFSPGVYWMQIATSKPSIWMNLLRCGLPLTLLCFSVEGYALTYWLGKNRLYFHSLTADDIMRAQCIQGLATLALFFLAALIIQWINESFNFRPPFRSCFTLAVYGLSPLLFARFLNCIPEINPWISVGVGITGCFLVLYQGVATVLEPDQTKGFGLYILMSMIFAFLGVIMQLLGLMLLERKI